jgi:ubiquinone/menaquinone biosynthesis C-methylase UbiE
MDQPSQQASLHESTSLAEIYEQHMVPAIFAAWVPALVELLSLQRGHHVLDVACGTGLVARHVTRQVGPEGRVVGLDVHPNMLAMARRMAPEIEWREGNAIELPFSEQEFDAVVCQQGLQFFPNKPQALREMHRILIPEGRLALALWCPIDTSPGHHALAQGLARHVSTDAATLMYNVFGLGEAETISALLEEAGFREIHIRQEERMARFPSQDDFTKVMVMGSALGRTGVKVSDDALKALSDHVKAALQPYVHTDGLIFPMQAHLVRATT